MEKNDKYDENIWWYKKLKNLKNNCFAKYFCFQTKSWHIALLADWSTQKCRSVFRQCPCHFWRFFCVRVRIRFFDRPTKRHICLNLDSHNYFTDCMSKSAMTMLRQKLLHIEWSVYDSFPLAFRIFNMDDLFLKLPPSGRVWKILGRRQKETLFMTPQRSTLHPLPNRIVIPGGRLVFVTTKTTFKGVFLFLFFSCVL